MVKLILSAESSDEYVREQRLVRELDPTDTNTVEEYVERLIVEPPRNESELEILVALYERLGHQTNSSYSFSTFDAIKVDYYQMIIAELPENRDEVHAEIQEYNPRIYSPGNNERAKNEDAYLKLRESQHEKGVEQYRQWQTERMQQYMET